MDISLFGWSTSFQTAFDESDKQDLIPARIISEDRSSFLLMSEMGEMRGKVSGSFRHTSKNRSDFPAVGDWAAVQASSVDSTAVIQSILPRMTEIARKSPGENTEKQVLSANINTIFIVSGLDNEFNLRRLERYISLVWNSGANPVIVLTKVDLLKNIEERVSIEEDIQGIAFGVPVHFVSLITNEGVDELQEYFEDNKTVAFLGSSGVGKSTLTNYLLGDEVQKTNATRGSDSHGRHTTTRRQLFLLPNGGMLIDTPGMRELQLWIEDKEKPINQGFSDIESLAQSCRFADCTHSNEPACSVQAAVNSGELDKKRLANFNKLQRELNYLAKRQQEKAWDTRLEDRKHGKLRHKVLKARS